MVHNDPAPEQILIQLTAADSIVQLRGMSGKRYAVRWLQVVGADYPTDTVFYITGRSEGGVSFGTPNISNVQVGGRTCYAFPLTAATCTIQFHWPLVAIDSSREGAVMDNASNQRWEFHVNSNSSGSPTFTRLFICLERML